LQNKKRSKGKKETRQANNQTSTKQHPKRKKNCCKLQTKRATHTEQPR
jgi:hypothetical protein